MNIRQQLEGGNPRSLGNADVVAAHVLANQDQLEALFECVFDDDEIVRLRSGDALEKVCRQQPDLFRPYIDRLFNEVANIDQASVQWHLAQMIGELPLDQVQTHKALDILKRNLRTATDWIVLNYSLQVFASFVQNDASLRPHFLTELKRHSNSKHKSVAKRAQKLLLSLQ